jgi:hypothetical protein
MSPKNHVRFALSLLTPHLRTPVRFLAAAVLAIAFVVGAAAPQPAGAIPVAEGAASWIAATSREIALELRRSSEVPAAEQSAIAERKINELAGLVAHLLDADAEQLRLVWTSAPLPRKIALFSALSQVGVPYRTNADAPFIALDCSALTKFAWAQAGVPIERGSQYQYARAERVTRDDVKVGDLVWYPGHIMFSLGVPELIVHARSGQRSVEIHRIDSTRLSWMRWVSPLQ